MFAFCVSRVHACDHCWSCTWFSLFFYLVETSRSNADVDRDTQGPKRHEFPPPSGGDWTQWWVRQLHCHSVRLSLQTIHWKQHCIISIVFWIFALLIVVGMAWCDLHLSRVFHWPSRIRSCSSPSALHLSSSCARPQDGVFLSRDANVSDARRYCERCFQ